MSRPSDVEEDVSISDSVLLRDVTEDDLPIFFEHQLDPEATHMAAFPSRDRETFMTHWDVLLGDDDLIKQTILYNGQVAGNIGSWETAGERDVGYWLGREFWGKGIATRALSAFLEVVQARPLYAHVAKRNDASRRVLEKCGFQIIREEKGFPDESGQDVDEYILRLDR